MDVYIDTNMLFSDPFWNRNFANELLSLAKKNLINIYISDVVVRELQKNYIQQIKKEVDIIVKATSKINDLCGSEVKIEYLDIEKEIEKFDDFYRNLFNDYPNIIRLKKIDLEDFEEVLERAVVYRKPFKEGKSEFKDAIIWLSYSKIAKKRQKESCFFLTQNLSDFSEQVNKNEKEKDRIKAYKLHKDLSNDYDKFVIYISFEGAYKVISESIDKPNPAFESWIKGENIDNDYVFNILINEFTPEINDNIVEFCQDMSPSYFFRIEAYDLSGGYTELASYNFLSCINTEIDVIEEYAIISTILIVNISIDIHRYNMDRDLGESKFPRLETVTKAIEVFINFKFSKNENPGDFEVTGINFQ